MQIFKTSIQMCLLVVTSFSSASEGNSALAKFSSTFAKQISEEYGLTIFGSGASFPVKLEYVALTFQDKNSKDVSEARRIIVAIAHKMIEKMNQDTNLQKYLANVPATVANVDVSIIFKELIERKDPRSLHSVSLIGCRGKIFYDVSSNSKPSLVTFHEEMFEEAERIVKQGSKLN